MEQLGEVTCTILSLVCGTAARERYNTAGKVVVLVKARTTRYSRSVAESLDAGTMPETLPLTLPLHAETMPETLPLALSRQGVCVCVCVCVLGNINIHFKISPKKLSIVFFVVFAFLD